MTAFHTDPFIIADLISSGRLAHLGSLFTGRCDAETAIIIGYRYAAYDGDWRVESSCLVKLLINNKIHTYTLRQFEIAFKQA